MTEFQAGFMYGALLGAGVVMILFATLAIVDARKSAAEDDETPEEKAYSHRHQRGDQ